MSAEVCDYEMLDTWNSDAVVFILVSFHAITDAPIQPTRIQKVLYSVGACSVSPYS